jgi:hypothetical protein
VIYVDDLTLHRRQPGRKGGCWCHLATDGDVQELHDFAKKIGLKKNYFQENSHYPQYDITERKRELAVKNGAKSVRSKELALILGRKVDKKQDKGETQKLRDENANLVNRCSSLEKSNDELINRLDYLVEFYYEVVKMLRLPDDTALPHENNGVVINALTAENKRLTAENVGLVELRNIAGLMYDALKNVEEWGVGADENGYCYWCGASEPDSKPQRDWYGYDEDYEAAFQVYTHPHKPDCKRLVALSMYENMNKISNKT